MHAKASDTYIKLIQTRGWSIEECQKGILGVLVLDACNT